MILNRIEAITDNNVSEEGEVWRARRGSCVATRKRHRGRILAMSGEIFGNLHEDPYSFDFS